MRIGILTGGGDAPGLNAAIRAVALPALAAGDTVLAVRDGWKGMLGEGSLTELTRADVDGIITRGGTILGSSRTNPAKVEGGYDQVRGVFESHRLDALVAAGGDDTLGVASRLAGMGLPVVGVPKTMDNDLAVTEYCIGFDTAAGIATDAVDRLRTTGASHHRVMVVEVMGRDAGWVAVAAGIAGGADMLVIPEFEVGMDTIVEHLETRRSQGYDNCMVVVAEGGTIPELADAEAGGETDAFGHVRLSEKGLGERLAGLIEERAKWESRFVVLGHLQRGGTPTQFDRVWATRVGHGAYGLVRAGRFGEIPIKRGDEVHVVPLADVAAGGRTVPRELYEVAQTYF